MHLLPDVTDNLIKVVIPHRSLLKLIIKASSYTLSKQLNKVFVLVWMFQVNPRSIFRLTEYQSL